MALTDTMGNFFKPKRKVVDYETEMDLPAFHVDVNGFVIFDDPSLGGTGIIEVTPMVMTQGITHRSLMDPTFETGKDGFDQRTFTQFADRRKSVIPQWVALLNALQPDDEADDAVHVQILIKKVRDDGWDTAYQYAIGRTKKAVDDYFEDAGYTNRRKNSTKVMQARARDYVTLLNGLDKAAASASSRSLSIGAMHMSMLKTYIVVSYTPSAEGWWLDGRDSDYYVSDDWTPANLFKSDKLVERIGSRRSGKESAKRDEEEFNTANMLFPIKSDMTSQVLETRIRKIERRIRSLYARVPEDERAFSIRRLHPVETTVLISMFNDVADPHAEKVWGMGTNYNDVLYGMRVDMAMATGDVSYLPLAGAASLNGGVDMRASEAEEDSFLSQFVGVGVGESETFGDELRSSREDARDAVERQESQSSRHDDAEIGELWGDFGDEFTFSGNGMDAGEAETREFLRRYAGKGVSADRSQAMRQAAEEARERAGEPTLSAEESEDAVGANVRSTQLLAEERLKREEAKRRTRKRRAAERASEGEDALSPSDGGAASLEQSGVFSARQDNPYARGLGMDSLDKTPVQRRGGGQDAQRASGQGRQQPPANGRRRIQIDRSRPQQPPQ